MKKFLLLSALALAGFNSMASHMMGGQITARNIGGTTYEVTSTFYRDMSGIPMTTGLNMLYTDVTNSTNFTRVVPQTSFSFFGNGTEEYIFIDTVPFPAPGNYKIAISECCRNPLALNFPNPAGYDFYLEDELWVDATNSSPVFLNPPVPVAQLNTPFSYNPMPFDIDGDSLTWELDTPMTGMITGPGTYVLGYVVPFSDPLSPFTMDPLTGQITFLPNTMGSFQVSCLINEFRNGVQIGKMRRDMQILVLPSPNQPPTVTSGSNQYPYSGTMFTINPGSSFNISLSVIDADGQGLSLSATGEPLLLVSNPATVTLTTAATTASATVNWTPDASQVRTQPYLLSLRITETYGVNQFSNDITYQLKVGNATGINNNDADVVRGIYPNPNNGNFTVEMQSDKSQSVSLSISNIAGQQMKVISQELNSGLNLLNIQNLNLPDGTYIMSIISEGKVMQTKAFEVKN